MIRYTCDRCGREVAESCELHEVTCMIFTFSNGEHDKKTERAMCQACARKVYDAMEAVIVRLGPNE